MTGGPSHSSRQLRVVLKHQRVSRPVNVSPELYDYLTACQLPDEALEDTLRRLLELTPRQRRKPAYAR